MGARLKNTDSTASEHTLSGTISWMVHNPVAANLLMLVLLIGGILIGSKTKQEVFPEFSLDRVLISVPYPGASPAEIERGVVLALEEAIRGLDGIKEVTSSSSENIGSVLAELEPGYDNNKLVQDIKNAVDRITTIPEDAEEIKVKLLTSRHEVISVAIYGDTSEIILRNIAEKLRSELLQNQKITQVELSGIKPLEITIEVPQKKLREHNLTLEQIAQKIRQTALELPGGGIKTKAGEILLRLNERRDYGAEFPDLPIISKNDGTILRVRDLGTVKDGFADLDREAYYNGKPAIMLNIFRVGDQTPSEVANVVRKKFKIWQTQLPPGIKTAILNDQAKVFEERFDLLIRNAKVGLLLVVILLGLFLELRLAFWVMMGIPVSFLGAILFLPATGVSINMISLFAFIMALGMVVDDAIVVGENIYEIRRHNNFAEAAVKAARQVAMPVTFSILTNIVAFSPMLFVPGFMGKLFRVIPIVVISVFIISLLESLFVLPAHLGHQKEYKKANKSLAGRIRISIAKWLDNFIAHKYAGVLSNALKRRYLTMGIGTAILIITIGLIAGKRIRTVFIPQIASDRIVASATLPFGSPLNRTRLVQKKLIAAACQTAKQNENPIKGIFSQIGAAQLRSGPRGGGGEVVGGHVTNVTVYLQSAAKRNLTAKEFAKFWRKNTGEIAGLESLNFLYNIGGPSGGSAIDIELHHKNIKTLETAANELAHIVKGYSGTRDIDDGFSPGKPQLNFKISPEAQSLGLTALNLGKQVRNSFYGAEAIRQQRGRDEIKVMVKLPEEERISEYNLENMIIISPSGAEIPLPEAASIERGQSYTKIERKNGRRTVHVTADVEVKGTAGIILDDLTKKALPKLLERYPSLDYELTGNHKDMAESMSSLGRGFIFALLVIYALLAIPFRSYIQPLIIMISIPFGIVGAIIGHLLMGFNLSIVSMFGIVALSGVVVNDSLVLIDYANQKRRDGFSAAEAIHQAGTRRFRPIILTSLTTFGGLAPMIFETSIQARFLIPMALSLGYGILFATLIALILVPALYLIVDDIQQKI